MPASVFLTLLHTYTHKKTILLQIFLSVLCPCLLFSHFYFSCKLTSPAILLSSHLKPVAACHPIIADHPDNVSVSHSSQMTVTQPSCSVTRDMLGSSNLRSCLFVPMHVYFCVFVNLLSVRKGETLSPCVELHYAFKCIHVCTELTELEICMNQLVWIAWYDLERDLCSPPPDRPLPSHNTTSASKAPVTFFLHIHLSIMFYAAQQHRDTCFSVNWTLTVYTGTNQHLLSVFPEVTLHWDIINHCTQLAEHLPDDKTFEGEKKREKWSQPQLLKCLLIFSHKFIKELL